MPVDASGWLRASAVSYESSVGNVEDTLANALFRDRPYNVTNPYRETGEGQYCSSRVHYGLDIQTKSVGGRNSANEPFYSLTPGEVIKVNESAGLVAVWGGSDHDATVTYLHARRIDVEVGAHVRVGEQLGIQGNLGLVGAHRSFGLNDSDRQYYDDNPHSWAEHVHVELRWGKYVGDLCAETGAINPLDGASYYLARSALGTLD